MRKPFVENWGKCRKCKRVSDYAADRGYCKACEPKRRKL
jgi:hypothetical protein